VEFIPVNQYPHENQALLDLPECRDTIHMTLEFYKKIGFNPPWIGYYASIDGVLVGSAGFKGKPVNGKIEIAYGTMPEFRQQGIGAAICRKLVQISLETDPSVVITARTLPEFNYSARILQKNGFECLGPVWDEEDGEVWEWVYRPGSL
jgi:RimJ/RimL family protein N-acetyltransferase